MLKIVYPICCGLDVHKSFVFACIASTDERGVTTYKNHRFSTFSKGLRELSAWLAAGNCCDVCMESTGKYWIPVYNILEKSCKIVLAHPKYVKSIRGKKTDKVDGAICPEQAEKLRIIRAHLFDLDKAKANLESAILTVAEKFADQINLVSTVPGIKSFAAVAIIGEVGVDMSVFPTAKHLCSWAGLTPQNNESAGKKKTTRISRAGAYIKPLLVQCANAAIKSTQHPEIGERYSRLKKRRGHKKAIIAIARMMLVAVFNILKKREPYNSDLYKHSDLPPKSNAFSPDIAIRILLERGYSVSPPA